MTPEERANELTVKLLVRGVVSGDPILLQRAQVAILEALRAVQIQERAACAALASSLAREALDEARRHNEADEPMLRDRMTATGRAAEAIAGAIRGRV